MLPTSCAITAGTLSLATFMELLAATIGGSIPPYVEDIMPLTRFVFAQ
ncbi:hypothetical protein [Mycobacterium lepromatosis]|nr:hypothetical protein [Mycobacterium lepromatosis]